MHRWAAFSLPWWNWQDQPRLVCCRGGGASKYSGLYHWSINTLLRTPVRAEWSLNVCLNMRPKCNIESILTFLPPFIPLDPSMKMGVLVIRDTRMQATENKKSCHFSSLIPSMCLPPLALMGALGPLSSLDVLSSCAVATVPGPLTVSRTPRGALIWTW